jgi:hypothetical protein
LFVSRQYFLACVRYDHLDQTEYTSIEPSMSCESVSGPGRKRPQRRAAGRWSTCDLPHTQVMPVVLPMASLSRWLAAGIGRR